MRLTREQRQALFAGEAPKIAGEGKCPVSAGDRIPLSRRVWLEVDQVRRPAKGGWSLRYTIRDCRDDDRYLRAPSIPIDSEGEPLPMSEDEAHGYTTDPRRKLLGEDAPAVSGEYQNVLVMEARERHAQRRPDEADTVEDVRRVAARIKTLAIDLVRSGGDPAPLLARIERELARVERQRERRRRDGRGDD